jgi:hypothetical protein
MYRKADDDVWIKCKWRDFKNSKDSPSRYISRFLNRRMPVNDLIHLIDAMLHCTLHRPRLDITRETSATSSTAALSSGLLDLWPGGPMTADLVDIGGP